MVGVISKAPKQYFSERISDAITSTGLELSTNAQEYISNMLIDYIKPEIFFIKTESGIERPVLTNTLLSSKKLPTMQSLIEYIHIGNNCLFISGFLEGYVNRKMKDIGYCVKIGEYSYGKASVLFLKSTSKESAHLFSELEKNFKNLVEIVSGALGSVDIKESEDVSYLIERYLATGNKDALKRLAELGITIPDFYGKA